MESFKLVRPEHLNHYGYLFGGILLKWVDEAGWISASRDYPKCNFVTVGMDRVEFRKSIRQGSILRFESARMTTGKTSATYSVNVFATNIETGEEENVFSTNTTFVCLNDKGEKRPI